MTDFTFSNYSIKKRIIANINNGSNLNMLDYGDEVDNSITIYPDDLFIFNDDAFIIESYKAILNRPPDRKGLKNNLKLLKNGIPKSYILYSIIKSREGKSHVENAIIKGKLKLALKYYLYYMVKPFTFINKDYFLNIHKFILSIIRSKLMKHE